ncbi:MAG: hypothetical protein RMM28_03030, partial [Thermoleophilia bacterium]|nr:hypothetical protein [Thermoleophilia bacterium]
MQAVTRRGAHLVARAGGARRGGGAARAGEAAARASAAREARPTSGRAPPPSRQYVLRVERALRARHDAWGRELLAAPTGPTLEGAERYLRPLLLARAAGGRLLTPSGVHYLPFSLPESARGATAVALFFVLWAYLVVVMLGVAAALPALVPMAVVVLAVNW